ncbi:hypothetical protein PSE_0732 [Pseudovibrio sp. FO-BEG1]|nr:hypothetical protein PSE_0732 [Pseudovibrio sp. FO-BEG1]
MMPDQQVAAKATCFRQRDCCLPVTAYLQPHKPAILLILMHSSCLHSGSSGAAAFYLHLSISNNDQRNMRLIYKAFYDAHHNFRYSKAAAAPIPI